MEKQTESAPRADRFPWPLTLPRYYRAVAMLGAQCALHSFQEAALLLTCAGQAGLSNGGLMWVRAAYWALAAADCEKVQSFDGTPVGARLLRAVSKLDRQLWEQCRDGGQLKEMQGHGIQA